MFQWTLSETVSLDLSSHTAVAVVVADADVVVVLNRLNNLVQVVNKN